LLTDVEVAEQLVETLLVVDVVILRQHVAEDAFAEAARAEKEDEVGNVFQIGDDLRFVHKVKILGDDFPKIRYSIRESFHIFPFLRFYIYRKGNNFIHWIERGVLKKTVCPENLVRKFAATDSIGAFRWNAVPHLIFFFYK